MHLVNGDCSGKGKDLFTDAHLLWRRSKPLKVSTSTWLWNTARGINGDEVQGRFHPKSHGSGKTFPRVRALKIVVAVEKCLKELCEECSFALEKEQTSKGFHKEKLP
ncbi:DNA polymerase eta [Artemisia annua]|uniref:DNA polymerase eta n=1 Tax=Artemisia annua TaxID=35608 RepID=A0A2U1MAS8_ARTAN|nr:DNA polymerase eta [Artemisia annua]